MSLAVAVTGPPKLLPVLVRVMSPAVAVRVVSPVVVIEEPPAWVISPVVAVALSEPVSLPTVLAATLPS